MKYVKIESHAKMKIYIKNHKMERSAFGAAKKDRKWDYFGGVNVLAYALNSRYLHYPLLEKGPSALRGF